MFAFYPTRKVQKPEEPSASQLNLLLQDNKEYFDKSTNTDIKEYFNKSTNTDTPEPDYRSLFERIEKRSEFADILYVNLPTIVFLSGLLVLSRN